MMIIMMIIIITIIITCLLTHPFSPWHFSSPNNRSGFQLPTAALRVLCVMFLIYVAVFCSESIECVPGTASKFFRTLLVTIPVAQVITGIIIHFRFHIRCMSIHKISYFSFFFASLCTTFLSAGTDCYIYRDACLIF